MHPIEVPIATPSPQLRPPPTPLPRLTTMQEVIKTMFSPRPTPAPRQNPCPRAAQTQPTIALPTA